MIDLLVDTHSHFDVENFDEDRDAAFKRAWDANVRVQIVPAVTAALWDKMKNICQIYDGLYPAYGLHPIYLTVHTKTHLSLLPQWLEQEKAVAVGECGLDYFVKDLDQKQQIYFFTAQLEMAKSLNLPVIVHARRSVDEVIKYIRKIAPISGVVHSFVGSEQQARILLDLGFYLSFGGPITYPRAQRLHRLVKALPLTRLLLETDSPDQPLVNRRGQRNEPAYLPEVLTAMALLRQQSKSDIAQVTTANALQLFNI